MRKYIVAAKRERFVLKTTMVLAPPTDDAKALVGVRAQYIVPLRVVGV